MCESQNVLKDSANYLSHIPSITFRKLLVRQYTNHTSLNLGLLQLVIVPNSLHIYNSTIQSLDELTTKQVYTTELIDGMAVDKCESLDQETRDRICFLMLDLFFRELFEFQFMQTDPNWANFLYNAETKQVGYQ
jgi:hypothetical protein